MESLKVLYLEGDTTPLRDVNQKSVPTTFPVCQEYISSEQKIYFFLAVGAPSQSEMSSYHGISHNFFCSLSPLKVMCVQYWPAAQHREEVYSGIGVTVDNEEQLANFMIRTIRLRVVRIIRKFWDQAWNCSGDF